ncbi:MAG: hypothetical protein V4857_01965 [Pseudomonadota bacterium]
MKSNTHGLAAAIAALVPSAQAGAAPTTLTVASFPDLDRAVKESLPRGTSCTRRNISAFPALLGLTQGAVKG